MVSTVEVRGDTCIIGRARLIFRAGGFFFLRGKRRGCFVLVGASFSRKLGKFNVLFAEFNALFGNKYVKAAELFVLVGKFNDKVQKNYEKEARFFVVLA